MDYSGSINLLLFISEEWKLLLFLTLIFIVYYHYTSTFAFFEEKGVKFMKPTIFLGNLGPRLALKKSFHDFQLDIYEYFKGHPYGGIFEGRRPVLYIFNPDLIKAVTVKDFEYFVDRNSLNSRVPRFLTRSLINLKGKEWKSVRSILTPTFSSARLRNMMPLIEQCSSQMVDFLKTNDKNDVEMKDTMGHFTLEVIGVCAFGIHCDALKNKDAHFIKVAGKFNEVSKIKRLTIFFCLIFMPQLLRFLKITFLNLEASTELVRMLQATKSERKKTNVKGHDFLQILIDAAENEQINPETNTKHLDDDTLDAQSLLFLFAGFETSSTLLSFMLHELAVHSHLQDQLREHVLAHTEGQELTTEILAQMTLLEAFLLETLRLYPPVSRVDRVCTKKYTLPETNIVVNPNDVVAIPVYGIHMDPKIYPDPEKFRPERFMGEEKKQRPAHLFLGFGVGPRNCIGLRFAMTSAKVAMIYLLKNFRFTTCEKTEHPISFEKKGILLKAEKGLWINIEAINK